MTPLILLGVAFILAILMVKSSSIIVKHGEVVLVQRLGRHSKTLNPGLHFIVPFIDHVARVSSLSREYQVKDLQFSDANGKIGKVNILLKVQIINAEKALYTVADFEQAVCQAAAERIKVRMLSQSYQNSSIDLARFACDLQAELSAVLEAWGAKLELVKITPNSIGN